MRSSSRFCLALLALGAAARAGATPSATLTVTVTEPGQGGAPVGPAGILTGELFAVSIQYEISGLSQPAHLEVDVCNEADWLVELPTGGTAVEPPDHDLRCPPYPAIRGRSYLISGPTLSPGANSTQSVTGVFSFATSNAPGIVEDGFVWDIPIRLVLDGAPATDLLTEHVSLTLHARPNPQLFLAVVSMDTAVGPDGTTPGFNVTYRVRPDNSIGAGVSAMPGTSTFVDPIPAGASFVSATIDQPSELPGLAGFVNLNKAITTTSAAGSVTSVVFSVDRYATEDFRPLDALVTLFFPMTQGGLTTMTNQVSAHWGNGVQQSASTTNIQGTVGVTLAKGHGPYGSHSAAHSPNFGDNLDSYTAPGAPLLWSIYAVAGDDNSGGINSSLVAPVLVDKLPAHVTLTAISRLVRQDGLDLRPTTALQISTDPDCSLDTAVWSAASWYDPQTFAAARCLRVAVPGLMTALALDYTTLLADPWKAPLRAVLGSYEFEDNYLTLKGPNVSGGYSVAYGPQVGSTVRTGDRATFWNVAAPNGRGNDIGAQAVGSSFYITSVMPWAYAITTPDGFENLTFAETLPLSLDLDGPPIPAPFVYVQPYATDGRGNDRWEPTCTWQRQNRATIPVTPASYRCTFPGHFPGTRSDPYAQQRCQPPNSTSYCFGDVYNAGDDAGHALFNSYVVSVPARVVAGAQGEIVRSVMKIWADNSPDVVATGLTGSSEAHAAPIPYAVLVGGHLEMVLQKSSPATTLTEGGTIAYSIRFSNTGEVGTNNTRIYDLFARDSRTGAPLAGCEQPRFVSASTVSLGAPAAIFYTTDPSPTPTGASWTATLPADPSTVTGLRISPQSAFSTNAGDYSPLDAPLEVQVTLADTAGPGARMCNTAALTADGFAPTLSSAAVAEVTPSCQAHVYGPASDEHGMIFFEDRWPSKGDDDFNDQSVTYNQDLALDQDGRVTELLATFNVLSVGATLHNGLYLHLPLPASTPVTIVRTDDAGQQTTLTPMAGEHELVIELSHDTRQLFADAGGYINTEAASPVRASHAFNVHLTFGTPAVLDTSLIPYDVFLARSDDFGHQIHLAEHAGTDRMDAALFGTADDRSTLAAHFIDQRGLPFALTVPSAARWPLERRSIDLGYPDIIGFAQSGGATNLDWYSTNLVAGELYTHGAQGALPPAPVFVGPGLAGACPANGR